MRLPARPSPDQVIMSTQLMAILRRLQGSTAGRWLWSLPFSSAVYRASLGALTRRPWRFAANELMGRRGTFRYLLRHGPETIVVRHRPSDANVVGEVFWSTDYEPPAEAAARLQQAAPLRVADIGANIGLFGIWARRRWPGCTIVSVEPDPTNARVCAQSIAANDAPDGTWSLIEACAWTSDAPLRFATGRGATSQVVAERGPGVIELQAIDAWPLLASVDLIKLDIEGSEWVFLTDPRFARLPAVAIVLEYHDTGSPDGDTRRHAERLLDEAGFTEQHTYDVLDHRGMIWAWRPQS